MPACLYCQRPCEADLFAMEPTWQCSWCQFLAHVACYQQYHVCQHSTGPEGGSPKANIPASGSPSLLQSHHKDCVSQALPTPNSIHVQHVLVSGLATPQMPRGQNISLIW